MNEEGCVVEAFFRFWSELWNGEDLVAVIRSST